MKTSVQTSYVSRLLNFLLECQVNLALASSTQRSHVLLPGTVPSGMAENAKALLNLWVWITTNDNKQLLLLLKPAAILKVGMYSRSCSVKEKPHFCLRVNGLHLLNKHLICYKEAGVMRFVKKLWWWKMKRMMNEIAVHFPLNPLFCTSVASLLSHISYSLALLAPLSCWAPSKATCPVSSSSSRPAPAQEPCQRLRLLLLLFWPANNRPPRWGRLHSLASRSGTQATGGARCQTRRGLRRCSCTFCDPGWLREWICRAFISLHFT